MRMAVDRVRPHFFEIDVVCLHPLRFCAAIGTGLVTGVRANFAAPSQPRRLLQRLREENAV